jgi:transcriptional regulator with XRE-family HTH domain
VEMQLKWRRMSGSRYLREWLSELGWTQVGLAERIDVTPTTVSRWMRDRVVVPGSVLAYVYLAVKLQRASRALLELDDGRVGDD